MRIDAFYVEQRVGENVSVETRALGGDAPAEHVDIEFKRFGQIIDGDADVLHALQQMPKASRPLVAR